MTQKYTYPKIFVLGNWKFTACVDMNSCICLFNAKEEAWIERETIVSSLHNEFVYSMQKKKRGSSVRRSFQAYTMSLFIQCKGRSVDRA